MGYPNVILLQALVDSTADGDVGGLNIEVSKRDVYILSIRLMSCQCLHLYSLSLLSYITDDSAAKMHP